MNKTESEKLDKVLPLPPFHAALAARALVQILGDEIQKTGLKKAVLGLSGGIDSALSMAIAVEALGADNVTAVMLPYKLSSPDSITHAQLVADQFGVQTIRQDITGMADAYFADHAGIDRRRMGNVLARLRMIVLYDLSARDHALVVGTSNKTEILLGYSTLWGDMVSAVNPIGDLFKMQVFEISRYFNIPAPIINKAPSADLWEGQSDEADLQVTYDFADRVLYHWVDLYFNQERIENAAREADSPFVDKIDYLLKRISASQFKRKMPIIAKVSGRTVNREFRYPRDWKL